MLPPSNKFNICCGGELFEYLVGIDFHSIGEKTMFAKDNTLQRGAGVWQAL